MSNNLKQLRNKQAFWDLDMRPPWFYDRSKDVPKDLPEDMVIVSGHTVLPEVLIRSQRIMCDTSGGRPGKFLSACIYPQCDVINTPTYE